MSSLTEILSHSGASRKGGYVGGYGSGRSRDATEAVESLLAALLRDDDDDVKAQVAELNIAHRVGKSKMSGSKVERLLTKVCASLDWDVRDARAQPPDRLGDVRVVLSTGEIRWIEVKAQTKKSRFADITQADYVRDDTDFLRRFDKVNHEFNMRINPELRIALQLDRPITELDAWSLESLWIADLALIDTDQKKRNAKVTSQDELTSFLQRKYLLQLCMEGIRYVRLDQLGPVDALLKGSEMMTVVRENRGSTAVIQISAGHSPGRSTTDFTYHVGYKNSDALGRHKLHSYALTRSPGLVEVKA